MKKRKIIIFITSCIIVMIAIVTETIISTLIGISLLLGGLKLCIMVGERIVANKLYKELLESIETIKTFEHEQNKAYFKFKEKEQEDEILQYDEYLKKCYKHAQTTIKELKYRKKYLSKKKLNIVLEIEKNEIRKTSRV